jgi:acetyl esterase/lipase
MAISPIGLVNMLTWKDRGSRRLGEGIPFTHDGRLKLDVYGPLTQSGPLPVIVFFYGGGWTDGERGGYEFVGRALAALGYVVVVPDYRLVPEIEYPVFLEDCAAAVRFVTENADDWGGNGRAIVLAGHSAGAYNAAMLALKPELFERSALAGRLRAVACISGPFDFYPFDGPISQRVFGAADAPLDTQPIEHVRAGLPPFFLATGERDRIVLPRNTVALAERLRSAGMVVGEKHYGKLEHILPMLALGRPLRFIAPVLSDLEAFLASALARS